MKAKITKDEFDKLDKVLQAEYEEQEGGVFIAKIEPVDGLALDDTAALKKAKVAEQTRADTAEAALSKFKDLDPIKARSALKKVDEMAGWKPEQKVQEQIEHLKREMDEAHGKEKTDLQARITKLEGGIQKTIVDGALNGAIAKAKGRPALLVPALRNRIRAVEDPKTGEWAVRVIGDDGNDRMSMKPNTQDWMSPDEYIETIVKKNPDYQPAFDGSGTSGTGGTTPARATVAGGKFQISASEARDPRKYQAMKAEAEKAGQPLQIVEG